MATAWYLSPYRRRIDPRPIKAVRYCAINDAGVGDIWREGEVLGNYAVVRADGTAAELDAIDAVPGVEVLPRAARLTTRLATLTAAQRNRILALAENLGYTAQEISDWRAQVGDAAITLFHLFEFIGRRRRKPRYDAATDSIVCDGQIDPVNKPWLIAGGAPTTSVFDDFNRAGPGIGSNWTADVVNLIIVGSAQVYSYSASDYAGSLYNVSTVGPPCEIFIDIATKPADGEVMWLRVRQRTTPTYDYYTAVLFAVAGTDYIQALRADDGVETQLGGDIPQEWSAGDGLWMEMPSSTLTIYRRASGIWSSLATRTDATYSYAGYLHMGCQNQTVRLDNVGGGTITAGVSRLALMGVG